MAAQNYASMSFRIGKLKGEILKRAMHVETVTRFGSQKEHPKNSSDTVVYRRYLPTGGVDNKRLTDANYDTYADDHQLQEGVTPTAKRLSFLDIQVTLKQYGSLYSFTDKTVDLGEDNITEEMKTQVGEELGAVREMVTYGVLRSATNVFFAGGTNRGTVSKGITKNILRKVTRALDDEYAKHVSKALKPAIEYGTKSVERAWVVLCHTDLASNIRNLDGFKEVTEYSNQKPISDLELGSVEGFRFLLSPDLRGYQSAGAAVGSTGLYSSDTSNVDVYPMIVMGEDAYGTIALRGSKSIDVSFIPAHQKTKDDPHGQRGYIGATTWFASLILNQGWMAVVECGIDELSD